ncbi:MAG: HEAT repeat domain-containing protein [Nitrospirae bacterium]|nr:HEAT repeat domain-containing protein [Nitrospirota bacterium]
MKNNLVSAFAAALVLVVAMYGCGKAKEPGGQAAPVAPGRQGDARAGVLTEEEQNEFMKPGGFSLFKEKPMIRDLRIMVKGSPQTIRWYKENEKKFSEGIESIYEQQICLLVSELANDRDTKGYELMIQILEHKTKYPKALACAAESVGKYGEFHDGIWYGERKAVPALQKLINHEDPEVRLYAASSLLRAGEGDISLPVLDELMKIGWSSPMRYMFAPEQDNHRGEMFLLDERCKGILKKALNYSNDEVKSYAAYYLTKLGLEKEACERLVLCFIELNKMKTVEAYGFRIEDGVPDGEKAEKYYSDGRACDVAMLTLSMLKSKKGYTLLQEIEKNNTEWWYLCGSNSAQRGLIGY